MCLLYEKCLFCGGVEAVGFRGSLSEISVYSTGDDNIDMHSLSISRSFVSGAAWRVHASEIC